jgi:hypothetical protein
MKRDLSMAGLSRRELLQAGGATGLAASVASMPAIGQELAVPVAKAKSVIQIWMWGGPAHLDTFDPKPDAGADYCGPYTKPIGTNVDGIQVCQMLPLLAQQADKYAILRSMTHGQNAHETASYMVQTGRPAGTGDVFPCAGAVTSYFKGYNGGYKGLIPPYIVLTRPQGRFSESGFLGLRYKPFATGGNPARTPFEVEGIVAQGMTAQRQADRRALLGQLDSMARQMGGNRAFDQLGICREQAYELILGDAGKVFDLATEDEALRTRYGRNEFGQACLMARRLVEQGVPYITINYQGWDTHKKHFELMGTQLPQMDRGIATLLADLQDRGLLESTVVWWGGEFGRGPKIDWEAPWNGGRNHYGTCFSHLIAGGGFKGGTVVGASDKTGENVVDRPIYPWDLIGSIYRQMGIDIHASLPHPQGKEVYVLPTEADGVPVGGLLGEIV